MKQKLQSIFWQLIVTLTAALLVLMVLVIAMLMQARIRQQRVEQEYFQVETQSTVEELNDKLKELAVVAAQLNQNDLIQAFITEEDTWTRYQYYRYIEDLLTILLSNNSQITSVDLYSLDGERYSPANTDSQLSGVVLKNYEIENPEYKETCFMLLQPYQTEKYGQFAYVTPIYALNKGEKIATLALFGTCRRLIDPQGDPYVQAWITDAQGSSYPSVLPEEADASFELNLGARVTFKQVRPYVDITEENVLGMMAPMIVTMLLILLTVGVLLIRQLTHPVMQLSQQMEMVRQNRQSSVQIDHGSIELKNLCDEINGMLRTIEQRNQENMLVHDQLYQAELARVEAQLYGLRNQINPHFLYNTLQTVRGMAMACGGQEIARIASNMAAIFRYSVREDRFAQLQEEMGIAARYMHIINVRHADRFAYTWAIEPELEACIVPRMIVQPVIENAVKYAFEHMPEGAKIDVNCFLEDGDVKIVLRDNGCGMSAQALEALRARMQEPFSLENVREAGGLGLHNIHQRLRLRYGAAYGLAIESQEGVGTRVEIRLPFSLSEAPEPAQAEQTNTQ